MIQSALQDDLPASWYEASVGDRRPSWPALASDAEAEVCVVGGGFAGLHAALSLAEQGREVLLLEGRRIGWGASGRNGGQVIPEFACGRESLLQALGRVQGEDCWALAEQGAERLRERIAQHAIECEYMPGHLEVAVSARRFERLQRDAQAVAARGARTRLLDARALRDFVDSPLYHGGLYDPQGGHLHPLRLALGLARALVGLGARVHERSTVRGWRSEGGRIRVECADGAVVRCRHLLLAANVGAAALAGPGMDRLTRRILPVGTWVIATEPLPVALADAVLPSRAAVSDNRMVMDYFRLSRDRRMIFGGGCSYLGEITPSGFAEGLARRMRVVFPQLAGVPVAFGWGGTLDISMNRAPDLGLLDAEGRVLYAQGFSGSGIVATCAAGSALAAAVAGDRRTLDLFRALPHRAFPGGGWLRAPLTAGGMLYHRLFDLF